MDESTKLLHVGVEWQPLTSQYDCLHPMCIQKFLLFFKEVSDERNLSRSTLHNMIVNIFKFFSAGFVLCSILNRKNNCIHENNVISPVFTKKEILVPVFSFFVLQWPLADC